MFAGSPRPGELTELARSFAAMWETTGDPVAGRRAEDRAAVGRLGASHRHLEHRDCIFRIAPDSSPLYAGLPAIFGGPPPAAEDALAAIVDDMRAILAELVEPMVVVPLGVGAHIDHRLVRAAAEQLVCGGALDEAGLLYFEKKPAVRGQRLSSGLPDTVATGLRSCPVPLDDDLWATKLDAVRAYRSQVPPTASLWPDETAMLREHGKAVLDATLAVRSDAPFACKGGVCGTCRAKLLDGTVRMDTNWALEPDEVEAGYVLTCQSHPTSPKVTLDYDA